MRLPVVWLVTVLVLGPLVSSPGQSLRGQNAEIYLVSRHGKRIPAIPFHGKLTAIDLTTGSFTLGHKAGGRVIYLSARTRITRGERRVSLATAILGEEISGQLIKRTDGKEEALSLRLGPKQAPRPKA